MKRLWAPWRMKFIENPKEKGCVFCNVLAQDKDVENLVVVRGRLAFVILNRYPYTSGHLMVVANLHRPSLEDLDIETRTEMMELSTKSLHVLHLVYKPEAFNFGANIGKAAGAGIAGHIHLHIVPRWTGDSNFMSTIGGTRVLPENLDETYQRIYTAWNSTN
jgi:ATP adenylyltransferase